MKNIGFVLAAAFCLAVIGSNVSAQTTYTWNQTGSAAWTTSTNWTPTRTTPAVDDVLVFNNAATTTATGVPTETIGQLLISGNTNVTLQPAAGVVILTIAGGAGTDFSVNNAGSALNISGGAAATNTLKIFMASTATAVINGPMTFSTAQHQFDAADASGITFNPTATFTYNPGGVAGNPFTNAGTANAVFFGPGSTYVFQSGADPFGLGQPSSKVVFQPGSQFIQTGTGTPSFSGRTYPNYELNNAAAVITVTGGNTVLINDLTITAGTLNFNMTATPGHSIRGNISVASGATLNFNPAGPGGGTVNLSGTSAQSISGAGTITSSSLQTVNMNNANGLTLFRNLTLGGPLTLTSGNITTNVANTLAIASSGSVTHTSGHIIGNLQRTFTATGNLNFDVGTANGYSPVGVNATAGSFPADFTVRATQARQANVNVGTSLLRFWTLTGTGFTANLTFNYLAGDVEGAEASYKVIRVIGGTPVYFPASTVDAINHNGTLNGVSTFNAEWTLGQPVPPTAATATISGRILTSNGIPVAGAVVYLSGNQNRKFITDANGNYRFDNVETNGFYTVTPTRANYGFSPGARSFSQLGNDTEATFTAIAAGGFVNPLDTPEYFVRQHYLDFLAREPDESGFNFWSDQILGCGDDTACIERRTVNVSAAYFLSGEFQQTGGLVDRLYKATYGRSPLYSEFMPDSAAIGRDVVVGRIGWEDRLTANKESFVADWVARNSFHAAFDTMSNDDYVNTLLSNTGVSFTQTERESLVSGLSGGTLSRGQVLQQIANNENFTKARFNEAFVMMEYFGYLRRDPDASGYQFWLDKLNQFGGNFERAEMVKAFIISGEYRARFR